MNPLEKLLQQMFLQPEQKEESQEQKVDGALFFLNRFTELNFELINLYTNLLGGDNPRTETVKELFSKVESLARSFSYSNVFNGIEISPQLLNRFIVRVTDIANFKISFHASHKRDLQDVSSTHGALKELINSLYRHPNEQTFPFVKKVLVILKNQNSILKGTIAKLMVSKGCVVSEEELDDMTPSIFETFDEIFKQAPQTQQSQRFYDSAVPSYQEYLNTGFKSFSRRMSRVNIHINNKRVSKVFLQAEFLADNDELSPRLNQDVSKDSICRVIDFILGKKLPSSKYHDDATAAQMFSSIKRATSQTFEPFNDSQTQPSQTPKSDAQQKVEDGETCYPPPSSNMISQGLLNFLQSFQGKGKQVETKQIPTIAEEIQKQDQKHVVLGLVTAKKTQSGSRLPATKRVRIQPERAIQQISVNQQKQPLALRHSFNSKSLESLFRRNHQRQISSDDKKPKQIMSSFHPLKLPNSSESKASFNKGFDNYPIIGIGSLERQRAEMALSSNIIRVVKQYRQSTEGNVALEQQKDQTSTNQGNETHRDWNRSYECGVRSFRQDHHNSEMQLHRYSEAQLHRNSKVHFQVYDRRRRQFLVK